MDRFDRCDNQDDGIQTGGTLKDWSRLILIPSRGGCLMKSIQLQSRENVYTHTTRFVILVSVL